MGCEPWIQTQEKLCDRYDAAGQENRQFDFDSQRHAYQIFRPQVDERYWAAQVNAAGVAGFHIKPSFDPIG